MNLAVIAVDVALMLVATVVLMLLLGALSRRLLGAVSYTHLDVYKRQPDICFRSRGAWPSPDSCLRW